VIPPSIGHYLSLAWHIIGPVWHWTAGQAVTAATVLSKAAFNPVQRPVLIYATAVALVLHFAPKIIRKVRRS